MSEPTRIVVPTPGPLLNANERLHWRARATRTKQWRDAAYVATRATRAPAMAGAHVTVWVRFPTNHRRDVGNYFVTAKACLDGIVDAGLLTDDRDGIVTGPDMRRELPNGPVRVTVELIGTTA